MQPPISIEQKQAALDAVLASEVFRPLERLRDFLTYIVEEDIAGRGEAIRGKTIAQDVYERPLGETADPENVVRVDARRLRQTLDLYYETAGKSEPVRIHVDTGGYRPRFEHYASTSAGHNGLKRFVVPGVALACGALLGALAVVFWPGSPTVDGNAGKLTRDVLERQAIVEKSGASLQAVNLAEQAREMIYPIFDRSRQDLVTEIFRRVIVLDPDYIGGYAGAAQTLATLAILAPPGPEREDFLAEARAMSDEAIRLGPADAWAQSARAWTEFAAGQHDEAMRLARRAAELAPDDGFVADLYGTIALFSGHFQEAVDIAESAWSAESNNRYANRNIFAAASFHLGDFQESLDTFTVASGEGRPVSPPAFAYFAANLAALGREDAGRRKIQELSVAWPQADLDAIFYAIFQHPEHAEAILGPVRALGWSKGDQPEVETQPTE